MSWVAAGRFQILVGVCWFCVKVSLDGSIGDGYTCVQEDDLPGGPLACEFDGGAWLRSLMKLLR